MTKQLRNFEKLAKFRRVKLARKKLKLKTIVQLSQVWDRNLRQFLIIGYRGRGWFDPPPFPGTEEVKQNGKV